MRNRNAIYLLLTLLSRISTTFAAPPIIQPISAASSLNLVRPLPHNTNITSLTSGPPPDPWDYQIPGSDLSIELSSLGFIATRDENAVETVLNDAFRASLMPFRPHEAMAERGYQIHVRGFLMGVAPSSPATKRPSERPLTWGMWTECLTGIHGYVEAYPGYDFSFDIWLTPSVGASTGYVIGSGFAITRG